ncbi:response regulator [Mesorhizobium sp.]|uniref:response regulator n=1 Tax=Mesorhizobium sp. TaxID=1871066 RepID=UPI000FE79453|nr:response regulator [Mesorhizobium sp.]RWK43267.1 MAG: response regulator [Mesorhizobium sp.]RWK71458.1 MAG: response regulator [Mesorhizobium sp.]RWK77626.1 MAG: response regulator [Mesorhizobium sp.]RWK81503.1 MAG: response regulator [Mesorhizobium sp.]RWL06901.1 MAG: response regulator [Mesorhizobium sp.]
MSAEQNTRYEEQSKGTIEQAAAAKHILVVDDDPEIREMLINYLESENFRVSAVADSRAMSRVFSERPVDLVLLDMRLADEDGFEIMRQLGSPPEAPPIIIITGHRRDEVDRVVGLELGADDYITKPFSLRELLARVRAVLRRSGSTRQQSPGKKPKRYRFAGWELDMRMRRLSSPAGEATPLTAGEFNLLAAFLQSPQQILSREQLLAASRIHDEEVFDRSIDVQILRLRRKLEASPSEPKLIVTERGAGYVFAAPVEVQ